ncbi:putative Type 1 protein exporter [Dioscorea sansibarensis]
MAPLVQTFSSIIIVFILALITSWRLAIVMISIQPLITLSFYACPVFLKKMLNKTIQSQSERSKLAVEAVSNIRTITVFSSQVRFLKLFQHSQNIYQNEGIKQSWFATTEILLKRHIKSYNLSSLRKHIALVSQELILLLDTIRENITYGIEGAKEREIQNISKLADVYEFKCTLKNGYETLCGDRGLQLSNGQKQRIAIARTILKNPVILIVDEATSALDSWSEKIMQETPERMMIGRTCVMVAHRLSTVQNCDLIVMLEKGKKY